MQSALKHATKEEYFALEEVATKKHEFFQGNIFAMAGGTFNHARISGNTFSTLKFKLRNKHCQPTISDMQIETPHGLVTYPDIAVYCGKPELTKNQCALLNPILIIEVLSPSTRLYDQSDKFLLYRAIPSFTDYLLIDSEKIHVQHFHKNKEYEWILHEYFQLNDNVDLVSINDCLTLLEMYEEIFVESPA
jgi:Uma2 family endonuclease